MLIKTPNHIESIAWEGELVPPETAMSAKDAAERPVVTLGKPELWPVADALGIEVGNGHRRWAGLNFGWLALLVPCATQTAVAKSPTPPNPSTCVPATPAQSRELCTPTASSPTG
ncbi:hypothetical protein [Candidatus Leptofilum sp.]|uniref:hypothetical protein n=1 Tax=Candidatus Leptofilum sp. TaxID=3241576 RepID=UPI003B5AF0C3